LHGWAEALEHVAFRPLSDVATCLVAEGRLCYYLSGMPAALLALGIALLCHKVQEGNPVVVRNAGMSEQPQELA